MSGIHSSHASPGALPGSARTDAAPALPGSLLLFLAAAAGLAVASIYYSQPVLGLVAAETGASDRTVGFIPTLTQLGYALGIGLLAPLGDRFDRRRIILIKAAVLGTALLLAGMAPSIGALLAMSLVVGLSATLAQDIVPAAAALAPDAHRGRAVGTVMTGLLLGVLLSRVASGFVAEHFGWRTVFVAAAASIALVGLAAWHQLPRLRPTTQLAYGALLGSLAALWKRHPGLRRATLAQGLLAIGFSAFWSTLALMLHAEPFHLGAAAAGAFGLAGAAGALAAPLAGRIADRRGPERVARLGAALVVVSFMAMGLLPLLQPQAGLGLLVLSAIGFDLGVQATLIAHQTLIYGIEPGARSRLNAVLFVGMFTGMAVGGALGSLLLSTWGWMGVTALSSASAGAALAVRLWPARPQGGQAA